MCHVSLEHTKTHLDTYLIISLLIFTLGRDIFRCVQCRGREKILSEPGNLWGQITVWEIHMSLCVRKPKIWVPIRSDTNRTAQSQKMVRSLKFWLKVEILYYLCSENKGADQLRGYPEADLRLCFRICRLLVFPCGLYGIHI